MCQVKPSSALYCLGAALLIFASTGCGKGDVKVYQVAKAEAPTGGAPHEMMPPAHGDNAAGPLLKYTTPAGWEEAQPGEMRAASFRVKGEGKATADVGVFPLPGMAGSDLNNVNRWRGQVGLAPITEEEMGKQAEQVQVGTEPGKLFDMAGEAPGSGDKTRILAAILRRNGMAWFFKMTGTDTLVASQKTAFVDFLKSVQFIQTPQLPPSHPPITGMEGMGAMGSAGSMPAPGPVTSSDKPQWTVPTGWKEVAGGQFLAAKFEVGGNGEQAVVNVSVSPGEGGGVAGNVNRWRGQLGLETLPPEQLKLDNISIDGKNATVADLTGKDGRTGKPARLIGVIVPQDGRTWFYKLMGDQTVVEREKDAFIQFLKTAKY